MAQVTGAMVKSLRERTGAGMMDCKRALDEAEGDIDKGIEIIRKMGLAKQDKKAHRSTKEGIVRAEINGNVAVLAEVLCETDFVAKNQKFVDYFNAIITDASTGDYPEGDITEAVKANNGGDTLGELSASVGENIQVTRVVRWEISGQVFSYIHDGGGTKLGVMVELSGDVEEAYGKDMAMHVCAACPSYICPEDVPAEIIEKEKEIAAAQPDLANKPAEILEKILIGKINKFYQGVCLTDQTWIHDDKTKVKDVNKSSKVTRFLRWQVGETAN
jgi:elongation factor Ts